MLSKIQDRLSVGGYSYTVEINRPTGDALVKVSLENMTPSRAANLFTQVNDWVIGGCSDAKVATFGGKSYSVFTVPLDSTYTLTRALNGGVTTITKSEDINVVLGVMLSCYLNHINNCTNDKLDIKHKMIRLDHAEVIFFDKTHQRYIVEWHISREIKDKSYG